ncbi:UNVERIFIED_CONTAM: hypothetical protein GTU68_038426 [Idotea baltica]|nr:hypothetical protein [Idotea baltica]
MRPIDCLEKTGLKKKI